MAHCDLVDFMCVRSSLTSLDLLSADFVVRLLLETQCIFNVFVGVVVDKRNSGQNEGT